MTEQDKKKQREIEEDARIEYHHTMPIQFRFTDADRFGHVNNSVYLQYYDTAKVDYFEKVGADIFHRDHAMVIAHIEFNFLGQVYTTDDVEVQTAITHIGRRRMKHSQRLIDRKTGEVKCEGFSIMVAYDLEKGVSTEVWPEWIEALNRYEGRELRSEEEKS